MPYERVLSLYLVMQWNGKESNKDERAKAVEFMMSLRVRGEPSEIGVLT